MRAFAASGIVVLAAVFATAFATAAMGAAAPASSAAVSATPPVTADNHLYGVSCVSRSDCVAVGLDQRAFDNRGGPLLQTWNGKTWKTVTAPIPAAGTAGQLDGVSCKSAAFCVAVGLYLNKADTSIPLAETWNGRSWTPVTLPTPAGATGVILTGVSCATAASCLGVGYYFTSTGVGALSESWNGHQWTAAKVPAPAGSVATYLESVSCASAAFCVGAGFFGTASSGFQLVESWNGHAWTRMTAPAVGRDASANGVSCASAANCVAVGSAAGSSPGLNAFTEVWAGKTWATVKVPWPSGTTNTDLLGVSCSSVKSCVAAGYFDWNIKDGGNTGKATAAAWNGKSWTVTKVPAPATGQASLFNGASCVSAAACVAVGQLSPYNGTVGNGLAGAWNGSGWKLTTTP